MGETTNICYSRTPFVLEPCGILEQASVLGKGMWGQHKRGAAGVLMWRTAGTLWGQAVTVGFSVGKVWEQSGAL